MGDLKWARISLKVHEAINNKTPFSFEGEFALAFIDGCAYVRIGSTMLKMTYFITESLGCYGGVWQIESSEVDNLIIVLWSSYTALKALGNDLYEDILKHLEILHYDSEVGILSMGCKGAIYNYVVDTPQNEVWHKMLNFFYEEFYGD